MTDFKAQVRIRTLMIAVAIIGAVFATWCFGNWAFNRRQREFLRNVHVGDTQASVFFRYGDPDALVSRELWRGMPPRLPKGGTLPGWGGRPARVVPGETWIYYMGPGDIHRIAVIFQDGIVAQVVHDMT